MENTKKRRLSNKAAYYTLFNCGYDLRHIRSILLCVTQIEIDNKYTKCYLNLFVNDELLRR